MIRRILSRVYKLFFFCGLILILYLTTTAGGLNLIVATSQKWYPDTFQIKNLHGSLLGSFACESIQFQNSDVVVVIDKAQGRLSLLSLFSFRVYFRQLQAEHVAILLKDTPHNEDPFPSLTFLAVKQAQIKKLIIQNESPRFDLRFAEVTANMRPHFYSADLIVHSKSIVVSKPNSKHRVALPYAHITANLMPQQIGLELNTALGESENDLFKLYLRSVLTPSEWQIRKSNLQLAQHLVTSEGTISFAAQHAWHFKNSYQNAHVQTKQNPKPIQFQLSGDSHQAKLLIDPQHNLGASGKGSFEWHDQQFTLNQLSLKLADFNAELQGRIKTDAVSTLVEAHGSLEGTSNSKTPLPKTAAKINLSLADDQQHKGALDLTQGANKISLSFTGAPQKPQWLWKLSSLAISRGTKKTQIWQLPAATATSDTCLSSGTAKLCNYLLWRDPESYEAHVEFSQLPSNMILNFLSPQITLNANSAGALQVKQADNKLSAEGNLHLQPGTLTIDSLPVKARKQDLKSAHFSFKLQDHQITSMSQIDLSHQQQISAQVNVAPKKQATDLTYANALLSGNLHANLTELQWLDLPGNVSPSTKLLLQADLTGTLKHPRLLGQGNLDIPDISFPQFGNKVKNISLAIHGDKLPLEISGQAQLGEGKLKLTGNTDFVTVNTHITGSNLLLMNTDEYQVLGESDLKVNYAKNIWTLGGSLMIPSAKLSPQALNTKSNKLPEDVVIKQKIAASSTDSLSLPLAINLQIHLGDRVIIDSSGLKTKLQGDVQISKKVGARMNATGEINLVEGKYTAYGQDLQISRGQISFMGSTVENPNLTLEASRKFNIHPNSTPRLGTPNTLNQDFPRTFSDLSSDRNYLLGIRITGNLQNPRLALFSQPQDLAQSDILSLLVFGKLSGNIDTTSLLKAATNLNLGQSDWSLDQKIRRGLGLDELSVESSYLPQNSTNPTTPEMNQSLIVGKKLSSRLFLHYSIGLLKPINTLKLRYQLGEKWVVETESGGQGNGIDLIYSIEK